IACEAATWLDEHFLSDLSAVKMNLDRYLVNGVNHIVYHGTPYSPKNEQWPGWMFYASVHFAPTNTWWEDLKTINSYVTNCQSFMQNSKPANDILLYYPIYDSWSEQSKSMLQHFGTANDKLTKELSEFLLTNGYMFDYISDKQIQQLSIEDNKIRSNKVEYKTILIPKCNYIPFKTIEKIISLAEQGATIIVEDNFPSEVPGLSDFKNRQQKFEELKKNIEFVNEQNIDVAKVKKGKILKGNNISILLLKANVLSEPMAASGLWLNRVNREEGITYLIINWSEKDIDGWVSVNSSGEDAVWFNPMNKAIGKARTKNINKESAEVYLQLGKGETLILQWYPNEQN
ncbi:MAG: glycoside hydrolase family 2 protein, partial [Ignavibacteriae bacterium]|nr:glycoside hydrolase family 2 protein [Ignavibacteriota bacterium]